MIATSHRTLARALDLLVAADGPLVLRLGRAAAIVSSLQPRDFDDHRLRAKFGALRDDIVMLDLPDAADIDGRTAMTIAIRILDLVFAVAQRAPLDE